MPFRPKGEYSMSLKLLALLILTLVFVYNLSLSLLKRRSATRPVPANVQDVYDPETYQKWCTYHDEKNRLDIVSSVASYLIELSLLWSNAYAWFASLFPASPFMKMLAVLLLSALCNLLLVPFTYYDTMHIEDKYGFNRSGKATFWADQVKEFLIGLLLMLIIGSVLMAVHQALGDWMLLAFAIVMTLLALGISFLYPVLSRVFNRFKPLEDGELKTRITALLEKNGYHVRAIKVMDASRRTTKSNAYFSGFGKMKTIVLYDTLVESMDTDEICAVFAHEMGHGLHRDTLKNQLLSFLQMGVLGVLAWLTLRSDACFQAFGFSEINYGFALILVMSVEFSLIAPLFGLFANWMSRRAEYRADAQAVREGYAEPLIRALKKLARQNFSDLAPSPVLVRLEYSHPTLSQRIQAIEDLFSKVTGKP